MRLWVDPRVTDEDSLLVPYAPDFTPESMGKTIGRDRVLRWLLEQVRSTPGKRELSRSIAEQCFSHVPNARSRGDMASHVVQSLGNYGLMTTSDSAVSLTEVGSRILAATPKEAERIFARHILAHCNGLRLIELIKSYELRGETPGLEDLARELDRSPTSKSISTMKSWLTLAGVMRPGARFSVDYAVLDDLLGHEVAQLFGLNEKELEFVIAARLLERQSGTSTLAASDVVDVVDGRAPHVAIRRKSLGEFVKGLAERKVITVSKTSGPGGRQTMLSLAAKGLELADDELRGLLEQSQAGFPVSQLPPMAELLENLAHGTAHELGHAGEKLAVHVCLMLGLKVESWRKRAPNTEIDLIAQRTAALGYQRWMVQVKNTKTDLSNDRVDRELGAAAGIPVTHVLFVVPRAGVSETAAREMITKSRLTELHVYALTKEMFVPGSERSLILSALRSQSHALSLAKQEEARRREGL